LSSKPDHVSFTLAPADNNRLASLCGLHDEHIRQIEQSLKVEIANRGNHFRVSGAPDRVSSTEALIRSLYDATESDEPLTPSGIHLAIQELHADGLDTERQRPAGEAGEGAESEPLLLLKTPKRQIKPRSNRQRDYIRKILTHDISFGIGPAGTGKTYLAVACAVSALMNQEVQRIVLVRPAVEAGERLGFLPGDLGEKIDPYLRPLYDALHDMLGPEKVNRLLERSTIELAPLAYMRGRTLNDSFIILDEAQNTTAEQMKMFLTRIGFGTTAVITGDVTQVDLPVKQTSGLKQVIEILDGVEGIAFTHFDKKDVVRHRLVQKIVEAYEAHDRSKTGRVVGSA
jgi:phosphate starvation-inducible PhoH-like protein